MWSSSLFNLISCHSFTPVLHCQLQGNDSSYMCLSHSHPTALVRLSLEPGMHSHQPSTSPLGQEVPITVIPLYSFQTHDHSVRPPGFLFLRVSWFLSCGSQHLPYRIILVYVSFTHQTRLYLHRTGTGYFPSVSPEPNTAADAHSRSSVIVWWRNDSMNNHHHPQKSETYIMLLISPEFLKRKCISTQWIIVPKPA